MGARRRVRDGAVVLIAFLVLSLAACAPEVHRAGPPIAVPRLTNDAVILADGTHLPLKAWLPSSGQPKAVVLALHGFNDYSHAFALPAAYWAEHGVATYAYDQRGFGGSPTKGLWPGVPTLIDDAATVARLVRARHRGVPFYLLGESMGGAVLLAASNPRLPPADGLILVAPAVRGRQTMNALYRTTLWLGAHAFPWAELTGRGLGIMATDNIEVLRAMQRDPFIIKRTRVEAVWGLVDLMDQALAAAPKLSGPPALVVYGTRDEVIPHGPVETFISRLPGSTTVAVYDSGYHMLLRDLEARPVLDDILEFIERPQAPLSSLADDAGAALFDRVHATR